MMMIKAKRRTKYICTGKNYIYVCERPRRRPPTTWSWITRRGKGIFIKQKMPRQLN